MSGYDKLEQNICDVIFEDQIKLGYRSEVMRLYYPLASLNRLLGREFSREEMEEAMCGFADEVKERLGVVEVTCAKERFCFKIPPEGVDYVHRNRNENEFLVSFIQAVSGHNCKIEDLYGIFRRYSDNVYIGKMKEEEFDYLLYFRDGKPDDYRYCIAFEGCHTTYHRFTPGDYREFGFGEAEEIIANKSFL